MQQLPDIALLLNVVSGVSCLPYMSTTYLPPTVPIGPFDGSASSATVCDVLSRNATTLTPNEALAIRELFITYTSIKSREKQRLRRILERLSQAKRRMQTEDKILDLGIALEMLLLDDNTSNDQLSMSFRLRGSWLLAKSADERVALYECLGKIYKYRSQVAHSGILCGGNSKEIEDVRQAFPQYQSIAEDACRKILRDGKPSWNKLILNAI